MDKKKLFWECWQYCPVTRVPPQTKSGVFSGFAVAILRDENWREEKLIVAPTTLTNIKSRIAMASWKMGFASFQKVPHSPPFERYPDSSFVYGFRSF